MACAEPCFLFGGGLTDPLDIAEAEARIAQNRAVRDELLALGTDPSSPRCTEMMHAWVWIIRDLRELGRMSETLEEAEAAAGFVQRGDWGSWVGIVLNDLGVVRARQGAVGDARQAFRASIAARRQHGRGRGDAGDPTTALGEVEVLGPLYRQMVRVAISGADVPEARCWQDLSAVAHRRALEECVTRWTEPSASAPSPMRERGAPLRSAENPFSAAEPLVALWHRAFDAVRPDIESINAGACVDARSRLREGASLAARLREHLLLEARVRRLEGDLAGAAQAIRDGQSLPYLLRMDEARVNFEEPMELARIALARRDYDAALAALARAERETGWVRAVPLDCTPPELLELEVYGQKPPIGPLARAEVDLLRGVTWLGLDPKNAVGRQNVEAALSVPRRMAAEMDPNAAAAFLGQFKTWREVAEGAAR